MVVTDLAHRRLYDFVLQHAELRRAANPYPAPDHLISRLVQHLRHTDFDHIIPLCTVGLALLCKYLYFPLPQNLDELLLWALFPAAHVEHLSGHRAAGQRWKHVILTVESPSTVDKVFMLVDAPSIIFVRVAVDLGCERVGITKVGWV